MRSMEGRKERRGKIQVQVVMMKIGTKKYVATIFLLFLDSNTFFCVFSIYVCDCPLCSVCVCVIGKSVKTDKDNHPGHATWSLSWTLGRLNTDDHGSESTLKGRS